jgi:hypothetical protein
MMRTWGWIFGLVLLCGGPQLSMAQDEAAGASATADDLTARLEASPKARLDVELKTGKHYIRCTLVKILASKDGGLPRSLKLRDTTSGKTISLNFSAIRSLSIDREVAYTAESSGTRNGKIAIVEAQAEKAAAEREKWIKRALENGVSPWPILTTAEHKAAEQAVREQIKKIQSAYPGLQLYETHEFFFLSNMPREQVIPYAASLDKMFDLMCSMYRIKPGTPVWKGKCLVVAFVEQRDFLAFEASFMNNPGAQGAQGICHQSSDGDVTMACYRGDSPQYFGQVLVHETSHGFIHRYRTMARLPSWANEGMADWIAQALVNYDGGVKQRRLMAVENLRRTRSLQGLLQDGPVDYGIATHLTDFLIQKDKAKYAEWVNGIKNGTPWEQSLKDSYGVTADQLITAFGQAIGVPDLRP